jgi:antitoxin component of MazEF toxin-antitoxin module
MNKIRKLQFMGNQHFLNIPAEFVKAFNMQQGDYMEIMQGANDNFSVRKVAGNDMPRAEVVLQALKDEAAVLAIHISTMRVKMSPGEFSGRLAQQSHLHAKIRRLERQLNSQIAK